MAICYKNYEKSWFFWYRQGAQTFFEQFRRTEDWHLGELKMASRRTHRRIVTQYFPTRSQEKYELRELVRRIHVMIVSN